MEKLPSVSCERLLTRIRAAENGKIPIDSLDADDWERFKILKERNFVQGCDPAFFKNDPDSLVQIIGPNYQSICITTLGKDYLSELSEERKSGWLRFGRDVVMLIVGAIVTVIITFLFNQLSGSVKPEDHVPVTENSPAFITALPDLDPLTLK